MSAATPGPRQRVVAQYLLLTLALCPGWLLATPPAAAMAAKGMPFTQFYPFEQIGEVFRGSRLSFDAYGRLAVVHEGVYAVLNDETWIDLARGAAGPAGFRTVVREGDGTRWFGTLGSWGILVPTPDGRLQPRSFAPENRPHWAVRATFSEVCPAPEGVYFASREGVVFWNRKTRVHSFFQLPGVAHVFRLGQTQYVSTFGRGTLRLDSATGTVEPLDAPVLGASIVDNVAQLPDGRAIVSTFARQLFTWDGTDLVNDGDPTARMDGRITALQALPEGLVAMAVNGKGLYFINPAGGIESSFTDAEYRYISALGNNEPGILWLAGETGVTKVNYGAPVTTFGQTLGISVGWPQFVCWAGKTVIASNGRVYEQTPVAHGEPARFHLMEPQPSSGAWGIAVHGDWLLLGNSEGLFARRPGGPLEPILSDMSVARLQPLDSGECLVVGEDQITAVSIEGGRWRECTPRVPGVGYPSMIRASAKAAWVELGTNSVARIEVQGGKIKVRVLQDFPWKELRWISISLVGDTVILSGSESGRVFFDERTEELTPHSALEATLSRMPFWPSRIQPDDRGMWWVSHLNGIYTFDPARATDAADIDTYRSIREHSTAIQALPNGQLWLSNGRTLLSLDRTARAPQRRPIEPRLVSVRDLRGNGELLSEPPAGGVDLRLPYSKNSVGLRFFFGTYSLRPTPEYEFSINRGAWSRLDSTSYLRLDDLREGAYHFEFRLVDPRGPLGSGSSFAILIQPPWYRSAFAYAAYFLGVSGLAAAGLHRLLRRARRRNLALGKMVAERTRERNEIREKLQQEIQTTATLAERNRLAGEIHDGVEQDFAGLTMQLQAIAQFKSCPPEVQHELGVAVNLLAHSRNEMRHVVHNLHSPVLASVDLEAALALTLNRLVPPRIQTSITSGGIKRPLGSAGEHHLLRIAQEAVSNAVKHASPEHIHLKLTFGVGEAQLTIEDDGRGFDPVSALGPEQGHFGLSSFKSRAETLGGSFEIQSAPGTGTRIIVKVPLPATPEAKARP